MGIHPLSVRDQKDNAAKDGHRAERHNDRRDGKFPDQHAVDRTQDRTQENRNRDDYRDWQAGHRDIDHRHGHAR